MDLRRKLARIAALTPKAPVADDGEPEVADDLRARIRSVAARTKRKVPRAEGGAVEGAPWPFVERVGAEGVTHVASRVFDVDALHGRAPLRRALDVTGPCVATLALDVSLAGFDPRSALFLDTETTGLAGGTGTLAFLVGMAWFEAGRFCVEQLVLADIESERPLLTIVAERIRAAGALVTYNGRSFDMPLLRSRFVMERVVPPVEPPHLDLLHVARRIYGARVERCTLTTLERDVLGFERVGDIDGAEIPERYLRYLREGGAARDGLAPVVEHNVWDLAALAALTGELGARLARTEAEGRFEANDLVQLARTTHRAGDADLAILLATDAAALGVARGEAGVARDAHVLAARIHKRSRDAEAMCARLVDALEHAPDDAGIHLELARVCERPLGDFVRALEHALRSAGAEERGAHARRVARLRRKVKGLRLEQLRLPGI